MGQKVLRVYVADPNRDIQTLECYRLNKLLMRLVGQWPFSPLWQQRLALLMFLCFLGNLYILELIHLFEARKDIDQIIDCFAPLMVNTASFIKLGTLFFGSESVREMFARMQEDWNSRSVEAEKRILEEYANNSKFLTFGYMIYMYFTMVAYLMMPTVPMALNVILPLNESRPKQLPSHAEYMVIDEPTDHYVPLFFHQSLGTMTSVTTVIICDTMYVTYVQHACGIFAILNYRLEHIVEDEEERDLMAPSGKLRTFNKIVMCIEEHKRAIKFAQSIESTYCVCNLLQMIINMLVISVTGVQTVINLDKMEVVMRFGTFTVGELMHLLYNSLPGQAIHDHSELVFQSAYNANWYLISKQSKDLLKLVMLRSKTPCQLTAGKLCVMDLERFSAVVQTSMSYFTVLTSMR